MSLSHVLLGLLSRASASGWDLKARLEADPALGWDATLAQIYPALDRLRRGGFASVRKRRSPKGPPRREYRVTPAGLRELRTWLAEPPARRRERDAAIARLAFLEARPPAERVAVLNALRDLVAEELRSAPPGTNAARRRRRALLETELAWADAEAAVILSRHPRSSA